MYKTNQPAIFTAQTYDTKTTVEIDHSDLDLEEVMNAFQTLIVGMGYSNDSLREWVKEKASEYMDDDIADGKYMFNIEDDNIEDDEIITNSYVANLPEEDIDLALAQHNADEEGDDFDDYGMRIHNND